MTWILLKNNGILDGPKIMAHLKNHRDITEISQRYQISFFFFGKRHQHGFLKSCLAVVVGQGNVTSEVKNFLGSFKTKQCY